MLYILYVFIWLYDIYDLTILCILTLHLYPYNTPLRKTLNIYYILRIYIIYLLNLFLS